MSNLLAARFQMAYSLGFHMIFAALGIGMPLLMLIAEGLYLRSGQERYLRLARTWAKATGILFAIGAVSGTALSFELGLLWPRFMGFAGSTLGPAFTLEGYAFFLEAIFLGLYLYGWERLRPAAHWLTGLVVALAGCLSGVLVLAADSWMQNPLGADVLAKNPEAMDAVGALFRNPAWPVMTIHSTFSAYATTAFIVAAVYAWSALKGKLDDMRRSAMAIALLVGTISALAMPITGDFAAKSVAHRQPVKLAAMEAHFQTEKGAPLRIGGWPNEEKGTVSFDLEIPYGLSFLSFGDLKAEVKGLNEFPRELWPNVKVTHVAFQLMVAAGIGLMGVAAAYYFTTFRSKRPYNRLVLWLMVAAGFLGVIALEAGWVVTEVGRQPWIIYGVMTVAEAVTPAAGLLPTLTGFVVLYALLGAVLVWLLNRLKHA
ncbi:MAG TPA: cytochrome ubiquinol oxidase subunit I [Symbiobacteriaceae bacterium]|nr:cytochrome ubiquinol oxidase subunit I [Symbiobacteriaceae bacterium]